ncbi:MAG: hypothetical protein KDB69_02805 [Acidimicrobiia bacterium]|nr:hypothetical protein [Acidimicrobiia bacterium]
MTARVIAHPAARTRGRTTERGPRILPLLLFVLLVIAVFFLMIYLRIALDRTAFELESVERQIGVAESRQLDLRLQLAELQDPLRIAHEAERMGLTYPDKRVPVIVNGLERGTAPLVLEQPVHAMDTDQP